MGKKRRRTIGDSRQHLPHKKVYSLIGITTY